ncbi:MAG: glycosyltransferase [Chitinophagaceae bacterium]|nr:MAG: glycosyltransferase [Chitinophagaceae bacterium]
MGKSYAANGHSRLSVKGKFLYRGDEKFYIKGVTYGTFQPDESGLQFPLPDIIETDFSLMSASGINSVRTYTPPPKHLLDIADRYGLKIMVGLPWEQHISFLDEEDRIEKIIQGVKRNVTALKGHPAILCFTIGNEIPASIVRWYGKEKIESFLKHLYNAVKETDPGSLVTYVNFPTTEYLDLSFCDFDCFNVYLETPQKLSAYVARLHNLAGDRPLVLAEIGMDSMRNGLKKQAEVMTWQIQTVFKKGCAGMFVFAWTDEWWRGGFEIEDWDFGLVHRNRNPKPALQAVTEAMAQVPILDRTGLPFISVVVCSYNGSSTIKDTLTALGKLDYPSYEVIVVNDGSTDKLADIVKEYPFKLITTSNQGLSNARNTGMRNAKGEIIAYIDDDAYPDPHWLLYLASGYKDSGLAGIGGPNIAPKENGFVARCVANSPGGPVHVLLTDEIAEHIPGCNMSFKKSALEEIGGFDPVFRSAGDDVDICWRLQKAGHVIGFHPSAVVWHHRRNSLKAYWKQQKGYGKAEALLEQKWPEKYNAFGHLSWSGRIYGNGFTLPINLKKGKVFYGTWGSALFQSVYQPADGLVNAMPLMPEWYLFSVVLAFLASLGFLWAPMLWIWTIFFLSLVIVITQATISASKNVFFYSNKEAGFRSRLLITILHLIQPMARLIGRLKNGLSPLNRTRIISNEKTPTIFHSSVFTIWSEQWRAAEDWLEDIETNIIKLKSRVQRGGSFDRWDVQARNSVFSISRGLLVVEEHGAGKQLIRFKIWPSPSRLIVAAFVLLLGIIVLAFLHHAVSVGLILSLILIGIFIEYAIDTALTLRQLKVAFRSLDYKQPQSEITESNAA